MYFQLLSTTAPSAGAAGRSRGTCAAAGRTRPRSGAVSWWTSHRGEAAGFNAIINKFNCDNRSTSYQQRHRRRRRFGRAAALQNRVLNGTPPDTFQVHMGHELLDT